MKVADNENAWCFKTIFNVFKQYDLHLNPITDFEKYK